MRIHIVQKGDTLWTIAKKYGVNFDELKKLNAQLSNPDLIMPGMKIKVPTPAGPSKKEMPMPSKKPKEAPISPSNMPIKEQPNVVAPMKEQPNIVAPMKEQPNVVAPMKEQPNVVSPMKEQPKLISPVKEKPVMPPLPPIVPEVEINQVFQMNMEQVQQTVQQPPPPPPAPPVKPDNIFPGLGKKEEVMESPSMPVTPPPMPEIEMVSPSQGGSNYPMNAYVNQYQMAPQVPNYGMQPSFSPQWSMPVPMMQPSYQVAGEMMESSPEEVSPNYPMMHYPSPDNVQGIQENMPPMPVAPMSYAPQMYPVTAPYSMQPYPSSCCVPITPVMPGTGCYMPYEMPYQPMMGYGVESPEYGMQPQVMGAYQPSAYYPQPMMTQPYMPSYYQQPMAYPAGGMGMPYPPPPMFAGQSGCGCHRSDEEDEE
ncbi:SafA/ExsA family spore coat assembly protein [Pseudobacillus wudalianchiensis]|uniref:LysM domain-containing protein n=1 Tax=Pseudobacillus wudalianchiensis TaxID=1743143 RepID=A0A1B9B8M6_9BACI|nr:SafA/ExsA family spore coat assembly protein [Bacillus wudalianchiensis]OCA92423.1 hypothetical protein A8F95_01545 [Bacillus wudalianchiensis]